MNTSQFPTSSGFAVGYIKPSGQPWQPILGSIVNQNGIDYVVVQGCIILGTVEEMNELANDIQNQPALLTDANAIKLGTVIVGQGVRWPGNTVPYEIDGALPNQNRVTDAIAEWEQKTNVKFSKHNGEPDFVVFVPAQDGCASTVGRKGGRQEIWLSDNCSKGNVIHEIGHTLGLWHEQSRIDRDLFIEILWANVDSSKRHNFDQHIHDGKDVGAYDFGSIMHYPPKAFSINGSDTIRPRTSLPPGVVMGQRKVLSPGDIATINAIYS
ncbi:M12 family metallopeptidase [Methylomonas rivi]|uniref:M12 family metallopeptidase n=1 Tax=Methylomonas rivi TaxID=2952226 RepID=A0ABT1U924_9GAMM|nr:M12 family metallopeptidase [Methylomonas sp. WSC-6]MCQ8130364.1 M12 family metallopeptidase [Methylomonas sp. WSC-6]